MCEPYLSHVNEYPKFYSFVVVGCANVSAYVMLRRVLKPWYTSSVLPKQSRIPVLNKVETIIYRDDKWPLPLLPSLNNYGFL